jgi:hypothetical protein
MKIFHKTAGLLYTSQDDGNTEYFVIPEEGDENLDDDYFSELAARVINEHVASQN